MSFNKLFAIMGMTFVTAAPSLLPPETDGNFFYMDFTQSGTYGMHQTSVLLNAPGEKNTTMSYPLWLSTSQYQMGVFTSDCPDTSCNVPKKMTVNPSTLSLGVSPIDYPVFVFHNTDLVVPTFTGS